MNTPRRRILAIVVPAACLAACGVLPPLDLQPPKLTFSAFRIQSVNLEETRFVLTVDADNPNDVDVPLSNLKFDLDLLGAPFASGGAQEASLTLPRKASRPVSIDFTVPTSRLLDLIRRVRPADMSSLSYRLKGSATWGSSGVTIPFERAGDLGTLRGLRDRMIRQGPRA